jgi:hypothetical protein
MGVADLDVNPGVGMLSLWVMMQGNKSIRETADFAGQIGLIRERAYKLFEKYNFARRPATVMHIQGVLGVTDMEWEDMLAGRQPLGWNDGWTEEDCLFRAELLERLALIAKIQTIDIVSSPENKSASGAIYISKAVHGLTDSYRETDEAEAFHYEDIIAAGKFALEADHEKAQSADYGAG